MPPRPESARLTELHRRAQNKVAADTVRLLDAAWPMLDPLRTAATQDRWLRVARPIIRRQHRLSARVASDYYGRLRDLTAPGAERITPTLATLVDDTIDATLIATGPVRLHNPPVNQFWPTTVRLARSSTASSAARLVLSGGRDTVIGTVQADRTAIGWTRILASSNPCPFCQLLASRGPVYRSEETATFQAHSGANGGLCRCQAAPAFVEGDLWTEQSIDARLRYEAAIEQAESEGQLNRGTANDRLNAFRRYLAAG